MQLPNLLIVDDMEDNLTYLEAVLKKTEVNIIQALSGKEALFMTRNINLMLAIIDVRMPGMDGYELAIKLNEERKDAKVPIIFLTAIIGNEAEISKGYASGAIDYLFKPINHLLLLSKVNGFIELHHQRESIRDHAELLRKSGELLARVNSALKKSERKYRNYIEHAPDGVFIADENGRCIEVNKAASRITGYTREELLDRSIPDLIAEESREDGIRSFHELTTTGAYRADVKFRHKDGSKRWWVVEAVKLSETRYLGFVKDITERYEMTENLRLQQIELEMQNAALSVAKDVAETASIKYSELYEFAPAGYFTISADDEILEVNPSGAHLLAKTRLALIGSTFASFVTKDTLPLYHEYRHRISISKGNEMGELTLIADGNQLRYVYIEGMSMADGKKYQLSVIDLSERKLIDQALKVSEEKYKTMLNASPDGILISDLHGIISNVSGIGIEIFGCENREEIIGQHFMRFVPSIEKKIVREVIEKTMTEGIVQNVEIMIRKKNGHTFLGEVSSTLIQEPGGEPYSFMVNIRDISLRKELETKQMHADRMASLGEMAAGIAHEINQPLNTMSMTMDNVLSVAAQQENLDKAYLKKKADKVFENITRIRNIIDHVRAFSRTQDDYLQTGFDINSSIINAISMISEQYRHLGIGLEIDLQENLPAVTGNTYKFEQVILNLLSNSKDALLEKKNRQSESFAMTISIRSYLDSWRLIIDVADNGIGISEEDVKHIMLPFYTTKDAGKGTGLGLSISYQIIKDMNGTIEILDHETGQTAFRIAIRL